MADLNSSDKRPLSSKMPGYLKERIYTPGEKAPISMKGEEDLIVYVGSVLNVRADKLLMDVNLFHRRGFLANVPITFPYAGSMGIIGSMPEEGTNVILIKVKANTNYKASTYYPIAYLPPGIVLSPDYISIQKFPDSVGNEDKNVFFSKFRELRKGDTIVGSGSGSEIFLDRDIELHSSTGGEVFLRSGDMSFVSTFLDNYMFADGVWRSAGLVQRNSLKTLDQSGNTFFGLNAEETITEDGKKVVYIRPNATDLSYGNKIYSEYRLEVDEFGSRILPSNDINGIINTTIRDPVCILAMGNFVGNDKGNAKTYGHLLGARLFDESSSTIGSFNLVPLLASGGTDFPSVLGMAYALHLPKSKAFIGIDKEGHYYQFFPASSSSNPLGSGRSISILTQGNKKEVLGSAPDGNSWDLSLKGGLKWRVGQHTDVDNNFSIDVRTTGAAYFEYGVPDQPALEDINAKTPQRLASFDGYGKIERVVGNSRVDIEGSLETRIEGSNTIRINGLQEFDFTAYKEMVGSMKTLNVGDSYSVTVLKEMNEKFGNRVTTILAGSDETTVLKGNITQKITTIGNIQTTATLGDITENILTKGNRTFSSTAGDYKVNCGAGNVEITTQAGKITVQTGVGTVKISGPLGVEVSSNVKIKINGTLVDIGSGIAKGAVLTGLPGVPSAFDPITGTPFSGVPTVQAG